MAIEQKVAESLILTKKTLALAESCTGGQLAHRLTNIPGSSEFLKLGIVAYSNEMKAKGLKVPPSLISKHGAVSEPVAVKMATNVRKILDTDFGIGISGIAGPDGGSKQKPVGLVFIALNTGTETICLKCQFRGTRVQIKTKASTQALKLLLEFLSP